MPNKFEKKDYILIALIFALALMVRLSFAQYTLSDGYHFAMGDDDDYHRLALQYAYPGLVTEKFIAYRMPLFPLILAVVYKFTAASPMNGVYFLIVAGSLTCSGTYWLARRWSNTATALLASFFTVFDLGLILFSQSLMTETLATLILIGCLIAFDALIKSPKISNAVVMGILCSAVLLIRVNLIAIVPFLLMYYFFQHKWNSKRTVFNIIVIFLLIGITWSGWIYRNFRSLGVFQPLTTQGGSGYYGIYNDEAALCAGLDSCGEWIPTHLPIEIQKQDEVSQDVWQKKMAIAWIKDNPSKAFFISLMQPIHFWHPRWTFDWIVFSFTLINLGVFIRKSQGTTISGIVIFALTFVTIFSIGVERFRIPLLPVLYILTAQVIVHYLQITIRFLVRNPTSRT